MLHLLSTAMFLAMLRVCEAASLDIQLNNNTSAVLISTNETSPRAYGLIHFEGQNEPNLNFQNDPSPDETQKQVIFKDDSSVPEVSDNVISNGINRVKKKRRRKQKQRPVQFNGMPQTNQHIGPPNTYPGQILPYPSFGAQSYRPYPGPSLASQAFSTVTDALTSVARYDDYQCVPRLLCEAAGGGSLGNSQILQSVSRLQPLLTILSAYNGISTNPLFVFGRAVFLGVSSKENSASCRYAYPLCPTDTEQLVHYLNNYNGGFFRFFSAPQQEQHQELGVEQFYNQLSSYGLYQSNQNPNINIFPYNPNKYYGIYQPNSNPTYGLYQQHQKPNTQEQHYGLYPSNKIPNRFSINQNGQNQYGLQRPGLYPLGNQYDYGSGYPYQNQIQNKNLNESKIEKRIQNRPNFDFIQDDEEPSWKFPLKNEVIKDIYVSEYNMDFHKRGKGKLVFPDSVNNNDLPDDYFESFNQHLSYENYVTETSNGGRKDRKLKFPAEFGDNSDYDNYRTENYGIGNKNNNDNDSGSRDFIFPENKRNEHYYTYTRENDKLETGNRYVTMTNEFVNMPYVDGSQTVYILRGKGDPNRPEVIKLKPGEMI